MSKLQSWFWDNGWWPALLQSYKSPAAHLVPRVPDDMKNYYVFYSLDSLNANIIVHEITHLVDFILEERAIENEGEAKAYLTGYISEKVFDYVLKRNLLINKWYKPQIIENQKISDNEEPNGLL